MSDARLTSARRTMASDGTVEAEVRWLHERLRHGTVGKDRIKLAAWLGHEPSRLICGAEKPCQHGPKGWCVDCRPPIETLRYVDDNYDDGIRARVAVAAARVVLPRWEYEMGWEWTGVRLREREHVMFGPVLGMRGAIVARNVVEAAEAWIQNPCAALLDAWHLVFPDVTVWREIPHPELVRAQWLPYPGRCFSAVLAPSEMFNWNRAVLPAIYASLVPWLLSDTGSG